MTDQTVITKAGDVRIKRIEIVTPGGVAVNVTNQFVDIKFYEDLFSPFITGQFRITDALALAAILPLVGEERVNIEIETPGLREKNTTIREQFFLYKMTDRGLINESTVVYTLHFVSFEAVIDVNRRISKTYQGRYSDIAERLMGTDGLNTSKQKIIEPTSNATKMISNFWTPTRGIGFLLDGAVNTKGTPSYVFFENREGFVFASLESLYATPVMQTFVEDNYVRDILPNGKNSRNIAQDYRRILEMHVPEFYDYLDRVQSGFYGSVLTSYDVTTKKYTYKKYSADSGRTQTLNPNAPVLFEAPNRPTASTIYMSKYYGNFNGYGDVTDAGVVQQRMALLKRAQSYSVNIEVFGRTDYTVGRVVELEIYKKMPIVEGDTPDKFLDRMLSGRYLISSICHIIDRQDHKCQMELIKDSILLKL